ncbi:type II toxin-antitoxin system RelB/DinJ family antitoxin [Liquorilactobacillus satsumensis]|uniref:type II toxin-antitoxin system RelB/DinJ family antitoxin n=1 Tax=Liquorilactobacillus satsumensis TaxID=259059 RepID=UPI0021C3379C|nr:type II toxin-antitoxin system RelB/DinJ family antitoxin [Liquorilactobacillus satsumensis]
MDKDLADNTEAVLKKLGLNPTTVINMFYKRIVVNEALPFKIALKIALNEAEKATEDIPVTKV